MAVCFAAGTPIFWISAVKGHSTNGFGAAVIVALYLYLGAMYWNYKNNVWIWIVLAVAALAHVVPLAIFPLEEFAFPGIALTPVFAVDAWLTSLALNFIVRRPKGSGSH